VRSVSRPSTDRQIRDGRLCGLAMIVAPLLILAGMVVHHPHGVDAASWLESAEAGRTGFYVAHLLFLASAAALVPVALGLADLLIDRERTLARAGRALALLGIAGFCVLVGLDLFLWQLVADASMSSEATASAAERVTGSVGINVPIGVLVAGMPAGFALLALGLFRTGTASQSSALAIALAVPLSFGGLPLGWLAIAGAAIGTAGMGSVGWRLLRGSADSVESTIARGPGNGYGEPLRGEAS
jgi:hypothetical protein